MKASLTETRTKSRHMNSSTSVSIFDAVRSADPKTVERLVKAGASIDVFDPESADTPLLEAIECNDQRLVGLLLRLGANPNLAGRAGETPLHRAVDVAVEAANREFDVKGKARLASMETIELLLRAGASPSAVDGRGLTSVDWARRAGFVEAVNRLGPLIQKAT